MIDLPMEGRRPENQTDDRSVTHDVSEGEAWHQTAFNATDGRATASKCRRDGTLAEARDEPRLPQLLAEQAAQLPLSPHRLVKDAHHRRHRSRMAAATYRPVSRELSAAALHLALPIRETRTDSAQVVAVGATIPPKSTVIGRWFSGSRHLMQRGSIPREFAAGEHGDTRRSGASRRWRRSRPARPPGHRGQRGSRRDHRSTSREAPA